MWCIIADDPKEYSEIYRFEAAYDKRRGCILFAALKRLNI
ncbi:hypothetical protein BSI_37350 [Bacillus inaquosorum KCTC 13429]|uniref:Uncharacterized protein n=1 Tax=Bacillus inaquosorum KCTC 13429 TaxID=1236548 RepID=A0A9W5LFP5_9BACI|nr:hypothetical protein BSI_37350 [Bacillus inaquosorum KCTC 13429]